MKFRFSLALLTLVILGASSNVASQRRKTAPPPSAPARSVYLPLRTDGLSADKKRRVETFEKVWRTIFYYYYDAKFGNLNWQTLKFEYEPKVRAARTDDELHDILDAMLARLKASHLGIIRPAVYEAIETAKETARLRAFERDKLKSASAAAAIESEDDFEDFDAPLSVYGPGIELRIIDNRFVVFRVGKNSAAEYKGIKPGFIVETVDDVSLSDLIARVRLFNRGTTSVIRQLPAEIVNEILNGDKDSTVKIGFLDAADQKQEVVIRRERLQTVAVSMGADYPEQQLTFEARLLDPATGYIRFDNFSLPVIDKFCEAVASFRSSSSLIIDLRGNQGGVIGISVALAGMLSDKPVDLGTSIYRYGPERLVATPKARHFKGRIIVLIDEMSVSAAEMFAASLQTVGRARVVGIRSAGETLPSVTVDLPTGARLLYPIANYRAASGTFLEGVGVIPDRIVPLDRVSLAKGNDPQLNAALEELAGKPEQKAPPEVPKPTSSGIGSGLGPAPPPPPPPAKAPARNLATVTVNAPPSPAVPPDVIDPKAIQLISDFERLSGGYEAYKAIFTYELTGRVDTVAMGARNSQEYRSYREGTSRHLVILTSPATGEMRNLRDGKSAKLKSDLGLDLERTYAHSLEESDFLYSITRSMKTDGYSKLAYLGIFDRGDRKVHLIDGKTKDGTVVAIYFDVETKLLAGFEGPTGGLSFADYRKVGNILFPYNISSQDFLNIQLTEVKLNTKIDPAIFERRVNCYDKPVP